MVAPTAIIKGLGMSIELDDIEVIGATGDYHSNFIAKAGFNLIFKMLVFNIYNKIMIMHLFI